MTLSMIVSNTFRVIVVLAVFFLSACATVERPDSWICGVNAKAKKLRCYNLKEHYDSEGNQLPSAKPQEFVLNGITDLNAWVCMDPESLKNMKTYMADLRDYAKAHCE